ncbi:MAG: hypothetical protein AB1724_02205 [Thermodesulfobacteriota bacterium]
MKRLAYHLRLRHLMYGYARLLQFAGLIDYSFRQRLAERQFTFVMTSRDNTTARYFSCAGGKLKSSVTPIPVDFKLIWRDNQTGGKIMLDMMRGKPKALYNAVLKGDLQLEGDAQTIGWYMKTSGRLEKVFRLKKKKKEAETAGQPDTADEK